MTTDGKVIKTAERWVIRLGTLARMGLGGTLSGRSERSHFCLKFRTALRQWIVRRPTDSANKTPTCLAASTGRLRLVTGPLLGACLALSTSLVLAGPSATAAAAGTVSVPSAFNTTADTVGPTDVTYLTPYSTSCSTPGAPVTVSGLMQATNAKPTGGKTVTIWTQDSSGNWKTTPSASAVTAAGGTFQTAVLFPVGVSGPQPFQLRFAGDADLRSAVSAITQANFFQPVVATLTANVNDQGTALVLVATTKSATGPAAVNLALDVSNDGVNWPLSGQNLALGNTFGQTEYDRTFAPGYYRLRVSNWNGSCYSFAATPAVLAVNLNLATTLTVNGPSSAADGSTFAISVTATKTRDGSRIPGQQIQLSHGAGVIDTGATSSAGQVTLHATADGTPAYSVQLVDVARGYALGTTTFIVNAVVAPVVASVLSSAAPSAATYGANLPITGTLSARPGGPLPGAAVTLYAVHGAAAKLVSTVSTNAAGVASFSVRAVASDSYQLRYAGDAGHAPTNGPIFAVSVNRAPGLTLTTSAAKVYAGSRMTLTTTALWPATSIRVAGLRTTLYMTVAGHVTIAGSGTTNAAGQVTWTLTPSYTATYQVRSAAAVNGSLTASAASSAVSSAHLIAVIKILSAPAASARNSSWVASGTVSPKLKGYRVNVLSGNRILASTTLTATGTFAVRVRTGAAGTGHWRLATVSGPLADAGTTPTRTLRVY
jgi:hypothetical protein